MNDDPCEPSVEEVLRIVRETPDEETRIRLLHAELLRLDPARADRLMQKYLRRRQRKAARDAEMRTVLKRVALHCLDCGAEIPAARLMAVPTAIRCVQCGTAKERTWNT